MIHSWNLPGVKYITFLVYSLDYYEAIEVRTSGKILRQSLERNGQEESKKFLKLVEKSSKVL